MFAIVAIAVVAAGCCFPTGGETYAKIVRAIDRGDVERETREIDLGDATRVSATLQFGGGELDISRGDAKLMRGEFEYRPPELAPVISYEVVSGEGELGIRQSWEAVRWDRLTGEPRNVWQIEFADLVPMNLVADVGASSGTLDLGGLPITDMTLTAGAADMSVSFGTPNPQRLQALQIRTGAARMELLSLGNANMDEMTFDGGLGDYVLDFQGEWQRSAQVNVKAGASQVLLRLPQGIGVRVCPGDLRNGNYGGLVRQGDCYVNEAYGTGDIRLDISLDLGLGRLDVQQME